MSYETIDMTRDGSVAIITLARPEKYHAVNVQMHLDLQAAFKSIARDREARAVVLAAKGKAFCAGQDLTEFAAIDDNFRIDDHVRKTFNKLVLMMRDLPKPIIGAINGVAAGAGASLALATDLRICAKSASFQQAFIRIGLLPDTGSTWFLPHMVGLPRALELAWTGRSVSADEALQMGMVNEVVEDDQLEARSIEFARSLAAMPTTAIGLTKKAMYRAGNSTLDDALEYEAQLQQFAGTTHDHREGVMAFLEKREPAFSGS